MSEINVIPAKEKLQRYIRRAVGVYFCLSARGGEKTGQDSVLVTTVYLCRSCDCRAPSHNRKLSERSSARSHRDALQIQSHSFKATRTLKTRQDDILLQKCVFLIVAWNSGGGAKCTAHKDNASLLRGGGDCISHHALGSKLNFSQSRSARAIRWVSTSVSARILRTRTDGQTDRSPPVNSQYSFDTSNDWQIQFVKLLPVNCLCGLDWN